MDKQKQYFNELIEELLKIKDKAVMEDFLSGLLTQSELIEIPQRIQIVKMLKQGIPHHQIAERLGVGVATVTRGSSEIKKGRFKNIK